MGRAEARSRLRSSSSSLDQSHVLRLGSLCTLGTFELDLRTFGKRLEAVAGDCAVVDEQVLAACVRGDEAIPLRIVEPLDGSGCHLCNTSSAIFLNGQRKRMKCAPRYSLACTYHVSSQNAIAGYGWCRSH